MTKDFMFKPRTQPMATYNKQYKARAKQRDWYKHQTISKAKEVLAIAFIVIVCLVDLEPLLDMLLG